MQKKQFTKLLSIIVCIVLVAAIALFTTACNGNKDNSGTTPPEQNNSQLEGGELGQGNTKFTFTVTDSEGKDTTFQIKTDKKMVGDALTELNLIAGDEGQYGLYVKTVNGLTYDYDKDGKYWAFYDGDSLAAAGVDQTEIVDGAEYSFKVE